MSNSPLVDCTVLSPNHSGNRTKPLKVITPHCVVGQLTAEGIGSCFPKGRNASCNYGIGTEGRVCLIVPEAYRSWCSSSNENDQQAVTIECASDKTSPYAMNTLVYDKLVDLCVDICQRNGAKKLIWISDKNKALDYLANQIADDEMIITVHRWFANKSCPGDWLFNRLGELANTVTSRLGGTNTQPTQPSTPTTPTTPSSTYTTGKYKVICDELNVRKGPGTNYGINQVVKKNEVYTIVEVQGTWGKLKSGAGWISIHSAYCERIGDANVTTTSTQPTSGTFKVKITVDGLNIRKGPGVNYARVGCITDKGVYTIVETQNGWGRLKSGAGWICLDGYTQRV